MSNQPDNVASERPNEPARKSQGAAVARLAASAAARAHAASSNVAANTQPIDSVAPSAAGPFLMGYVDEIHGPLGKECPDYRPTRFELIQLVKHWACVQIDFHLNWFYYRSIGSREMRMDPYAGMRLKELRRVLGDALLDNAIDKVHEKERQRMSFDDCRIFVQGTEAERIEVAERLHQIHEYLNQKQADKNLQTQAFAALSANPMSVYLDAAGDLWSFAMLPAPRQPGELILRVTTPRGGSAFAPDFVFARPSDWQPPYGLE